MSNPKDVDARVGKAQVHMDAGEWEAAIEELEILEKADDANSHSHAVPKLAQCHMSMGDLQRVRRTTPRFFTCSCARNR